MTIFTFSAPATKDYADQVDGNDWNRLVNALTGSVAELFTFTRKLTLTVNSSEAGLVLNVTNPGRDGASITNTTSGDGTNAFGLYLANTIQNASATNHAAGLYVTSVKSGTGTVEKRTGVWIDNGGGTAVKAYGIYITAPTGGSSANAALYSEGDMVIASGGKFLLDGASGVPGDSYIYESAANIIDHYVGGVRALRLNQTSTYIAIPATWELYFDGGGDTYIAEVSGNQLRAVVGGTSYFNIDHASTFVNVYNAHFAVDATKKIHLDGGGDTYIYESSANVLDLYAGGTNALRLTLSGATFTSTGEGIITAKRTGSGASGFEFGSNDATGGNTYIDLHVLSGADYHTRILRESTANGHFIIDNAGTGDIVLKQNTLEVARFDDTIADGETALLIRRDVGGAESVQRVSMGAADSGGAGYKVLRVPN